MAAFALPPFRVAPSHQRTPFSRHRKTISRITTPRAALPPPSPANPPHTFEGVSWAGVEHMCARLAQAAAADRFDTVLGITRGGMVPATLLCEALCLRNMLSATVMLYTDSGDPFFGMTDPRFLAFPSADALEGRRVLVVDDVWDSGRTAIAVKRRVERARAKLVKVAVLHYKPDLNESDETPDFYCETSSNWLVYPWENASPEAPHIESQARTDHESAPVQTGS